MQVFDDGVSEGVSLRVESTASREVESALLEGTEERA